MDTGHAWGVVGRCSTNEHGYLRFLASSTSAIISVTLVRPAAESAPIICASSVTRSSPASERTSVTVRSPAMCFAT